MDSESAKNELTLVGSGTVASRGNMRWKWENGSANGDAGTRVGVKVNTFCAIEKKLCMSELFPL